MYFYYGSESKPPCIENVLWAVTALPRSMSKKQQEFLHKQMGKTIQGEKDKQGAKSAKDFYGANRKVKKHDTNARGLIWSNKIGVKGTKYPSSNDVAANKH